MLGKSFKAGFKKAEVTIEITLSIALSIVVLFLVLGLFSENLSTMAANSGLRNLFNRDNSTAKTAYNNWNVNPTTSQVDVQISGDQGLDYYLTRAQAVIEKYRNNPPTTKAQAEEEAKAIANASLISAKLNPTSLGTSAITLLEPGLRKRDGISINFKTGKITLVNHSNATLSFDTSNISNKVDSEQTDIILSTVKSILRKSFN